MHSLIYVSAAAHLYSDQELIDILSVSRINNSRLGVTGLLLYHDGSILQILEGEEEILNTLFNKIKKDHRHKGVIKMMDISIGERSFQDWSMGFKQISDADWSQLSGYLDLDKVKFHQLTDSANAHIIAMIKLFANVNRMNI